MLDLDTIRYVPAKYQGTRGGKRPTLIVVHTGETGEGPTAAEGMAAFFARGPESKASTQLVADNNSIVRSVPDARRANGAGGGVNSYALHIEQAGRAGQKASDWADTYSRAVIANTARAVAAWSRRFGIPVDRRVTVGEMAAAVRAGRQPVGLCGHVDVTLMAAALDRDTAGHWDPGPAYPWALLIDRVTAELGTRPDPTPDPERRLQTMTAIPLDDGTGHESNSLPVAFLSDDGRAVIVLHTKIKPTANATEYGAGWILPLPKRAIRIAAAPSRAGLWLVFQDMSTTGLVLGSGLQVAAEKPGS